MGRAIHSGEKGPPCHDGGFFLTTVFCPFPPSLFSLILLEFKHKLNFFGPLLIPQNYTQHCIPPFYIATEQRNWSIFASKLSFELHRLAILESYSTQLNLVKMWTLFISVANENWMLISTWKRNYLETTTTHCSYFCAWML